MNSTQTPQTEAAWKTIETWMEYVSRGDIDSVVTLYSEADLAFWGTFANHVRTSRDAARTYFDRFLDAESVVCQIDQNEARQLSNEVVAFSGVYTFTIVKKAGDPAAQSKARFTYTLRFDAGEDRWMIVEHHSSLMPAEGY